MQKTNERKICGVVRTESSPLLIKSLLTRLCTTEKLAKITSFILKFQRASCGSGASCCKPQMYTTFFRSVLAKRKHASYLVRLLAAIVWFKPAINVITGLCYAITVSHKKKHLETKLLFTEYSVLMLCIWRFSSQSWGIRKLVSSNHEKKIPRGQVSRTFTYATESQNKIICYN